MSASTEIAELPRCKSCDVQMVLRDGFDGTGNGSTTEQRWCGVWYDHPPMPHGVLSYGHSSSVLFPSAALLAASAVSAVTK